MPARGPEPQRVRRLDRLHFIVFATRSALRSRRGKCPPSPLWRVRPDASLWASLRAALRGFAPGRRGPARTHWALCASRAVCVRCALRASLTAGDGSPEPPLAREARRFALGLPGCSSGASPPGRRGPAPDVRSLCASRTFLVRCALRASRTFLVRCALRASRTFLVRCALRASLTAGDGSPEPPLAREARRFALGLPAGCSSGASPPGRRGPAPRVWTLCASRTFLVRCALRASLTAPITFRNTPFEHLCRTQRRAACSRSDDEDSRAPPRVALVRARL